MSEEEIWWSEYLIIEGVNAFTTGSQKPRIFR